jgi:pimeloyl-ACP methyl ester carboxylesterase
MDSTDQGCSRPRRSSRTGGDRACPVAPTLTMRPCFPGCRTTTEDLRTIIVPVLVMHGDDDQIVPFTSSVPRAVDLLQNGVLKTYAGYPHGMLTTHADVLNPDLLAFIAS